MAGCLTVFHCPCRRLAFRCSGAHLVSAPASLPDQRLRLSSSRRAGRDALGGHTRDVTAAVDRIRIGNRRRDTHRPPDGFFPMVAGHDRRACACTPHASQCLLGAMRAPRVRANRERHALCRRHGHSLVADYCYRQRSTNDSAHLYPRRPQHGIDRIAYVDARDLAGVAALSAERHEAGLGLCLALADGGRNFCHDPDRFRARTPAALWAGTQRDGSSDRDHARYRLHRSRGGQNPLLPDRTVSSPAMGHGKSVALDVPARSLLSESQTNRSERGWHGVEGYARLRRMPGGWISRLSLGKKLVLSFSLILILLAGSLSAILFYLSRVNSYVERHQRITVPGVVTASEILRNVGHMQSHMHQILEHRQAAGSSSVLATVADIEQQTLSALDTYRQSHAARTHPILFGMLTQHGRIDLADREDQAIATIADGVKTLAAQRQQIQMILTQPTTAPVPVEPAYERTAAAIEAAVATLVDVHRKIDMEMKIEGDRLVDQARLIALGLVCLLGLLIVSVFILMRRQVADPLRGLAVTADRVAHHDLSAQFEPWPSKDEVGALAGSLTTMLTSLRDHSTALVRKTKELEAFTYSIAHDLKGPLREIEGFSSLLEKQFADTGDTR